LEFHKKRIFLFNKAAILLVLAGMAAFVDAYWIEPHWIQTEKVVIHDPAHAFIFAIDKYAKFE
jgi:hypothetical protein